MKKEVIFSAKFDTSDFDKSVESMQKKLKEIYAPADAVRAHAQTQQRLQQVGMGSQVGGQTSDQMANAVQKARRENDLAIREQVVGQEKLNKLLALRQVALEDLKKRQAESLSGSQKELEIKQKIGAIEEDNARKREVIYQKDKAINLALDRRQQEISANSKITYGQSSNGAPSLPFGIGGMGAMGGMALGFAGALSSAAAIGERYTGYGQRLQAARGSAVQNTTGMDLAQVYAGQSPLENIYAPERAAASGLADQKSSRNKFFDRVKGTASGIGILGGGAMLGAGLLGAAGSVLASPFTFGASAAGLMPSLGVAGAGAAAMGLGLYGASNDRTRMSMVPGSKEYQTLLASERASDFRKSYADLKDQDPSKKLTVESFEANRDRNVRAQRMMGLSNQQFYGDNGFMHQTHMAGFMTEQGLQNASAIVGAGGSGRMANSPLGLQMDRSGLNGASMLGSLSGSIQTPEANKNAVISIMSEAFKVGLDSTNFAEENRKFTQAAASVIGRVGVSNKDDQQDLAGVFSQFLSSKTNQGVATGANQYEAFQKRSSQTTGRRGALSYSAAMKDPLLGKLDQKTLTEALSIRDEDLNSNNVALDAIADRSGAKGATAKDVISSLKKAHEAGRYLSPDMKRNMSGPQQKLEKYMKGNNLSLADVGDKIRDGTLPQEYRIAAGNMLIEQSSINNSEGIKTSDGLSTIGEFFPNSKKTGTKSSKEIDESLNKSDRIEDQYTRKSAEGADEARKAFNGLTEELWKVVKGVDALKDSAVASSSSLHSGSGKNLTSLPQGTPFPSPAAVMAPNANKPKGK